MKTSLTLQNLNSAKALIEKASTSQLKEIISRAEALRTYAQQAKKGLEIQNQCAEIKLRAERRIGEQLKEKIQHGGQNKKARLQDVTSLKELGIEKIESHRWQAVASLPEKDFEKHMADVKKSNEELTTFGVIKFAKELIKKNEIEDTEIIETAKGKYNVIVIDPPWPYGTKYNSETRRVAAPYPEMSLEEIKKMSIPFADDCSIWLWTTHKFLPESFSILKDWGFEYKITLTWDKQKLGMGDWLRCQSEFCLLGIKGKPKWKLTNQRDFISEARREHSRKPGAFYSMVSSLCTGKMLDIFSREKRDGFDQYGNQTRKF